LRYPGSSTYGEENEEDEIGGGRSMHGREMLQNAGQFFLSFCDIMREKFRYDFRN